MRGLILFVMFTLLMLNGAAQSLTQKIALRVRELEADPQMRHAILSVSVKESITGKTIIEHNAQIGLAPASTQKIVTSVASFELLGKDFRYPTFFRVKKNNADSLAIDLDIESSGDPTFETARFEETTDTVLLKNFLNAFRKKYSRRLGVNLFINDYKFGNALPGGFIWEDIGNYYGAGGRQLNWRENQFDLHFNSSSKTTQLVKTDPLQPQIEFINRVKADSSVCDDQIIMYCAPESRIAYLEGSMPVDKKNFIVGGAMPDPAITFANELKMRLGTEQEIRKIIIDRNISTKEITEKLFFSYDTVFTHFSPTLDSINYYFLRKSINLYGEALIKSIAFKKAGWGSTERGIQEVRDFFALHGIDKAALNISDGSGLSPQNRVTTHALVSVLQYAKLRPWFNFFYSALPEFNGMKMKSGSIGGVRAFCGYHRSANGKEYLFSIIINNFDGSPGEIVRKMYRLLDTLK